MDILLWIAIIVLILLPPSLDPAIRTKMRQVIRGEGMKINRQITEVEAR